MLAEVLPWAPDGWIWVYFIPSSSVLCVDPDPGRWFVAESLRRSWWDLQQKGWLQSHCHQKWGKNITPSTPLSQSCTCICLHRANRDSRLLNKPALWEVWADCKTHHTNATVTVHPEWRTIALPWCAVCAPWTLHQVPRHPALGSLKFRVSTLCAPSLFPPCEPHRAVPSPPTSAPAVVWALWPNNNQQIHSFPNHSLLHHLPSTESLA